MERATHGRGAPRNVHCPGGRDDRSADQHPGQDPAGDGTIEDGTHITQGIPVFAPREGGRFVAIYSDTAGFKAESSGVGFSLSVDGGKTWTDAGQLAVTGRTVTATPAVAHDRSRQQAITLATECDEVSKTCGVFSSRLRRLDVDWDAPSTVAPLTAASYSSHDIAVDNTPSSARYGTTYATWTRSQAGQPTAVLLSHSDDGGETWSDPVRVSEEGEPAFGSQVAIGPTGTVYVSYVEIARSAADPSLHEVAPYVGRSTDGGATYTVVDLYPNVTYYAPGSLKNCGTADAPSSRSLLVGNFDALDFPAITTNPKFPNDVYLTFSGNPPGADEAAVYFSRSTNGGASFSIPTILANNPRDQFFPDVDVTPEGVIGVFWYDKRNSMTNLNIDVYSQFSADRGSHWGPLAWVTGQSFGVPQMFPRYDTVYANCSCPGGIDVVAPGSGFYVAWTDNRDPGPTANRGVDPNIYFARAIVPTVLTATVARTATRLNVAGKITPTVAGSVTVTLYRRNSAGSYARISALTRPLSTSGNYTAGFARPAAGSCRIITRYGGSSEYAASSKTVTFSC